MKSSAELKRDQRERMRALGMVLKQIWVLPKDWQKVRKYLAKLK